MSDSDNAKLIDALSQAQCSIRGVRHDKYNEHSSYAYTSAEAIIAKAREVLSQHGIAFFELDSRFTPAPEGFQPRGQNGSGVTGRLEIVYAIGGHGGALKGSHSVPVCIGKGRPDDKAEASARTYALAYALRGLLLIDRPGNPDNVGEEQEVDSRDDNAVEAPKAAVAKAGVDMASCKAAIEAQTACKTARELIDWASYHREARTFLGGSEMLFARVSDVTAKCAAKITQGDVAAAEKLATAAMEELKRAA